MRELFYLLSSNLKRKHGFNLIFLTIMILSIFLMNIGLIIWHDFGEAFHEKCDNTNSAEIVCAVSNDDNSTVKDFTKSNKNIKSLEENKCIYSFASFDYQDSEMSGAVAFMKESDKHEMGKIKFNEKKKAVDKDNLIYLPLIFKTGGGYKINDSFEITLNNKKYKYQIGGFYEDMMLGSTNGGLMSVILCDKAYKDLNQDTSEVFEGSLHFIQVKDNKMQNVTSKLYDYIDSNAKNSSSITVINEDSVGLARCNTANILAALVFAFSIVILAVALIVIRYKIYDYVQENTVNFGVLKALGYNSRQIILSVVLQFVVIISISLTVGFILSAVAMPTISDMLASQSGMTWNQNFDWKIALVIIAVAYILTIVIIYACIHKVKKMNPINALRNELSAKVKRHNYVPFDKVNLNRTMLLSLKYCLNNMKQNIAVLLVLIGISFVSMFAIILGYNTVINNSQFVKSIIGVYADVSVKENLDETYIDNFDKELANIKGTKSVVYFGYEKAFCEGYSFMTYVSNNFSKLDSDMCYKGKSPVSSNEIAISCLAADTLNKKIGDKITVSYGKEEYTYKITGLTQSAYSDGYEFQLTIDGYRQLQKDYKGYQLVVYLNKGTKVKDYMDDVKDKYEDNIGSCTDYMKNINSIVGTYVNILRTVIIAVFVVSMFIILLIMFLVVTSVITQMTRQLGIQKAIGYTGGQLILQLSASFVPVLVIGAVIGSILGYQLSAPLVSSLLYSVGIAKVKMLMSIIMCLMNTVFVCIFAYLITIIISSRINKISAISLIHSE